MNVAKLFNPLALRPNIEIIKPHLPEPVRKNWCAVGDGVPQVSPVLRDLGGISTAPAHRILRTKPSFNA